jgi:integrase
MTTERGRSARISKRTVDGAKPEAARYVLWDTDLKGFGLRVTPQGTKTYVARYRAGGGRAGVLRQAVVGRHGPLTADEARDEARLILASAAKGGDPQADRAKVRADITLADLCDLYLKEGVSTKKASTVYTDKVRIERHIKPLLGRKRVNAITSGDVERWMHDVAAGKTAASIKPSRGQVRSGEAPKGTETRRRTDPIARGGKGTAARTAGLLGGIFTFATKRGIRPDNPTVGLERYRDRTAERFLSVKEMGALGEAMAASDAAGGNTTATRIIRLLALTGARRGEIEGLRWSEVDADRSILRLADSKTGQKVIPLGAAAMLLINDADRVKGSPYVFPATTDKEKHFGNVNKTWRAVRAAAGLSDVRLHDLRHSFASTGLASGQGLVLLGKLLGHADVKTTSRYAHLADDPVRTAADRIAGSISAALDGDESGEVIAFKGAAR